MLTRKPATDQERRAIRALQAVLEPFRRLQSTMPLQYVTSFLMVAAEEGLGVRDYAERAGVAMSVMSRHLLDLGERNRKMEPGHGLLTYRANPMELRKHEYMLTPKGRAVLHEIVRNMEP